MLDKRGVTVDLDAKRNLMVQKLKTEGQSL